MVCCDPICAMLNVFALVNNLQTILLSDPDIQSKLNGIGIDILPTRSPDGFKNYVSEQLADWGRMIKVARIQPE
jgi:tripartite-type tricarboxylate transporter receptor subunit TctC